MLPIIKYIILNGIRDRLYIGLMILIIASFCLSIIIGSTFMIEQSQTTIIFSAAITRLFFVIGFILFVCITLNRSFENKEIEFIISKSISRYKIIFSYILGYIISALIILIPLILTLFIISNINVTGLLIWSYTMLLEALIIIIFSIVAALILNNIFTSILTAISFYALSRLVGVFVLTANIPENIQQFSNDSMLSVLKIISVIFPRIDLFSQSEWLIYGINNIEQIQIISLQAIIYTLLLSLMAFYDFKRKQF